jgi:glycosyltransferase involved in cell wall biosynthesis
MGFADAYLAKHAFAPPFVHYPPKADLKLCIVLPALNEPSLLPALNSLLQCTTLDCSVEILVMINASVAADKEIHDQNEFTFHEVTQFASEQNRQDIRIFPLLRNDLPDKDAGVGLARKIGMDEAVRRFNQLNQPKGIIAAFDADASCDPDFIYQLLKQYSEQAETRAAVHYFEHPLSGDHQPDDSTEAIARYELHLRYLLWATRFCGYPAAYHTVGSSFSVRASVYCEQGGMNRRKAGEDFYFLQKVFAGGKIAEINTLRILPSGRVSNRVPFGTGRAMLQMKDGKKWETYHPEAFLVLKDFFKLIPLLSLSPEGEISRIYTTIHESLKLFLPADEFVGKMLEIKRNTQSDASFKKRFFQWFNQFMIIRYLNDSHINNFQRVDPEDAAGSLLKLNGLDTIPQHLLDLLDFYRELDRGRISLPVNLLPI